MLRNSVLAAHGKTVPTGVAFGGIRIDALPEPALTILGFLHSKGIGVPDEASVICRGDDVYVDFCIPLIARYRVDCVKFGNATGALVIDVIRHGISRIRQVKVLPEFVPGRT